MFSMHGKNEIRRTWGFLARFARALFGPLAQPGRASAWHAEGRGLKSPTVHKDKSSKYAYFYFPRQVR